MRRFLAFAFAVFMLVGCPAVAVAQQPAPQQQPQTKEQIVYVTKTGKKYHTATCRYLSQSKIPMTLKDAKAKGYEPCKVCHPPQ
jgi:micrococcal nuclease